MAALRATLPALLPLVAAATSGCSDDLPGHYYEVTLETAVAADGSLKDGCNQPPRALRETHTYRVVAAGTDVQVFIDDDLLASGSVQGCQVLYQSATWSDTRGGQPYKWAIVGSATAGLGTSCAEGWSGTERIQIVESRADDLPGGCTVEFDVLGTYLGEVE